MADASIRPAFRKETGEIAEVTCLLTIYDNVIRHIIFPFNYDSTPEFFDEYPDKVEELEKLGLRANVDALVDDWNMIYESMKVYHKIHNDLRIPSK